MLDHKPFWYRFLWRHGWQPRRFKVLQEVARGLQYPFNPLGFVEWADYDGDFHLHVGDRDLVVDWRGRHVSSGTNVGDGREWTISKIEGSP